MFERNQKITLICPQFSPEKGAAASRMTKLARGLRARSLDVNVLTALPNYPTGRIFADYRGKFWHTESLDGILVKRYWLYPTNSAATFKRLLNMVSLSATLFLSLPHLLRNRPAVIIVNSPPLPVAITGIILAKIIRAHVITNVSDIWPSSALELGVIRRGVIYSLLEMIETLVYRYSDAIVSQSIETRQHVLERCPEMRTFLFRNLDYRSEFIDQVPIIEGQVPKLVYAGLLGVAQGIYEICQNVDFLHIGMEFHIYGDGNERSAIDQYITDNPGSNIFLHQAVSKNQMPEILAEFHATVIPLKTHIHGAFPSKIFMAISAGLPVIFCGSGESADFVQESGIGWVSAPRDYQGLTRNINALVTMTNSEYRKLRNMIRSLAISKYDLDDQLDRFVGFLESISNDTERDT